MKKKFIQTFLLLVLCLALFPGRANAKSQTTYVFQIDTAELSKAEKLLSSADVIYADGGYYRTDSFSLVQTLQHMGIITQYSLDTPIFLADYSEDTAYYTQCDNWCKSILGYKYASDNAITGSGVVIGVIDSGLSENFQTYSDATILQGINFLADTTDTVGRSNTHDTVGHGTFVTSTIASREVGLAPDVSIVPLKCFDERKSGISYIVEAIYAAVDIYHCDIINLSFGTDMENAMLNEAVSYAIDKGVIMVAAVGNTNATISKNSLMYPAACEGVIGVGAVNASKQISSVSKCNTSVDVVAPGDGIMGLFGNTWMSKTGTSFSTPVVTAAAALALSVKHDLTPDAFADLLKEISEDLGAEGYDTAFGYGLVNIGLMLATLKGDCNTVILSTCRNCDLIALAANTNPSISRMLATYDKNGKMTKLQFLDNRPVRYTVDSKDANIKIFTLQTGSFTPFCPVICYEM